MDVVRIKFTILHTIGVVLQRATKAVALAGGVILLQSTRAANPYGKCGQLASPLPRYFAALHLVAGNDVEL